jgi:hypothetical protein
LETIALFLRAVLFRKRLIFPLFQSRTACDWLMQGEIIIVGVEYSDPFDEGVRVDGGPCDEWWHSKWVDASDRRASHPSALVPMYVFPLVAHALEFRLDSR